MKSLIQFIQESSIDESYNASQANKDLKAAAMKRFAVHSKKQANVNKRENANVNKRENKKFDVKEYFKEMTWSNGGELTPEEIKEIINYCLSRGFKKVPSDEEYYQVKLVLNNSKDDTLYFQTKHAPWNDGCAWHWDYDSWRWSE